MANPAVNEDSKDSPSFELANISSHTDDRDQSDVSGFDDAYLHASAPTKIYRGVLFQMIMFGA
jgi:hypothetical protein